MLPGAGDAVMKVTWSHDLREAQQPAHETAPHAAASGRSPVGTHLAQVSCGYNCRGGLQEEEGPEPREAFPAMLVYGLGLEDGVRFYQKAPWPKAMR